MSNFKESPPSQIIRERMRLISAMVSKDLKQIHRWLRLGCPFGKFDRSVRRLSAPQWKSREGKSPSLIVVC